MDLIRQCLLLGALGYELILKSAFLFSEIVGDRVLKGKLIKLPIIHKSSASASLTAPTTLREQEKKLGSAGKRLDFVKRQLSKKKLNDTDKWTRAKTWSHCPIGMLPRIVGSSGRLPLLDFQNVSKQAQGNINFKRGAESNSQQLEKSTCKRARKSGEDSESNVVTLGTYEETEAEENLMRDGEESESCLLIGGEWKIVKDGELLEMASNVRICV